MSSSFANVFFPSLTTKLSIISVKSMFFKFLHSHIISAWSSLATKSSSSSSLELSICSPPPPSPLFSSLFFCLSFCRRVSSSLESFFKTTSTPFKETSIVGCIPTIDVADIRTQTSPTLASSTPICVGKNCPKYPSTMSSSCCNFTFRSVIFGPPPKSTDADTLLVLFPSSSTTSSKLKNEPAARSNA